LGRHFAAGGLSSGCYTYIPPCMRTWVHIWRNAGTRMILRTSVGLLVLVGASACGGAAQETTEGQSEEALTQMTLDLQGGATAGTFLATDAPALTAASGGF